MAARRRRDNRAVGKSLTAPALHRPRESPFPSPGGGTPAVPAARSGPSGPFGGPCGRRCCGTVRPHLHVAV